MKDGQQRVDILGDQNCRQNRKGTDGQVDDDLKSERWQFNLL